MFAVVRDTTYAPNLRLQESEAFQKFQAVHADQPGYRGSMVVALGEGRHVTVTLWAQEADMRAAREAIGPTVGRLLNPIMTVEARLIGTGRVVFDDLT